MDKIYAFLVNLKARFFIFIPPVLFILLAVSKVYITGTYRDPVQFFISPKYKIMNYGIWGAIILFALIADIVLHFQKDIVKNKLIKITYLGSLTLAFGLMLFFSYGWVDIITNSPWNSYYLSPDSGSYVPSYQITSFRPPVYPFFIEGVTLGLRFDHTTGQHPLSGEMITGDTEDPLLRVVQVQKIILLATVIFLAYILMDCAQSLLPFSLALFIFDFNYLTNFKSYVLTEALAQSLLILTIICLFLFVIKGQRWAAPLAGIICAAAYLIRPASANTFVILFAIIVWGVFNQFKKNKFHLMAAVAIGGLIIFSYIFLIFINTGRWMISPGTYLQRIGFAMAVSTPQDINLMPDKSLKQFYQLIEQKMDQNNYQSIPRNGSWNPMADFNTGIYLVAIPASSEMELTNQAIPHYDTLTILDKYKIDLLDTTANVILAAHYGTYLKIVLDFINDYMANSRFGRVGLVLILVFILAVAVTVRNKYTYCAVFLALTHVVNIIISSMNGNPDPRYSSITEILILIALFIQLMQISLVLINIHARLHTGRFDPSRQGQP